MVGFSNCGQEDRDEGQLLGSAQSAPEFREYSPQFVRHRIDQGVGLIPTFGEIPSSFCGFRRWIISCPTSTIVKTVAHRLRDCHHEEFTSTHDYH